MIGTQYIYIKYTVITHQVYDVHTPTKTPPVNSQSDSQGYKNIESLRMRLTFTIQQYTLAQVSRRRINY